MRQADHASIGLVLDTFHIFSRGTELNTIKNIPGDRIFLVQTADAPSLSMDHLSWSRHYRCFPGQGELNIDQFMGVLSQTGYDGPLSHEIFNDIFRRSDPQQTAIDGYRSSRYLASMLPMHKEEVAPKSQLSEIEFVEISTQKAHLSELQKLLSALGFRLVGKHRTMDAEYWRCGEVRFVLNTDQQFADKFLQRHGTGVAAIGLHVDNAYATGKRAAFLNIPVVEPIDVDAIHNMKGMQNVDGTVWYWVDASASQEAFDSAFDKTLEDESENRDHAISASINRIDHMSLSQSYPDVLSTLLSFRSLFELQMSPAFDVFDPKGLIQSQVISNESLSFQLAFNASDAQGTTSSKFIQRAKGSGVQHIALLTTDIFACAEALAKNDIGSVEIPTNYYPDLQSRFGLDSSLCDRMADHNILYDEDGNGSFYQLYTKPVDGKFYFEIVQRDGYRGLGAANAWLRATAQQISA